MHGEIKYSRIEGCDRDFFRCVARAATLSVDACEKMWREAQTAKGENADRLIKCRQCQIGAAHAGATIVERSDFFEACICPRCRNGTTRRMIGNRLCISCYNREREFRLGKNAKGTKPVKLAALHSRAIRYVIKAAGKKDRVVVKQTYPVVDTLEAVIDILRHAEGHVRFGFQGGSRCVRQLRLF